MDAKTDPSMRYLRAANKYTGIRSPMWPSLDENFLECHLDEPVIISPLVSEG